jgi:hypothetical protein
MTTEWKRDDRRDELRMRRTTQGGSVVAIGVLCLVIGLIGGAMLARPGSPSATPTGGAHVYLSVAYNPYTGLDEYFPANFTVPANVPVIITITNYDNGTNTVPTDFAVVRGTVGGTETVTDATAADRILTSVPATEVTHTFTVMSGDLNVNVPIPAAQGTTPTVVTFTVQFSQTGLINWHCMAPCDNQAMSTPGFMTGTITVVNG